MKEVKGNMLCPICGNPSEVNVITRKNIATIKGQEIEYVEKVYICTECKEEFMDGELLDENLLIARDVYRRKNGLLTSKEIAEIRNIYGLSQADFSLMLGFGEVTITRYESKTIQDSTYDMIIRMVSENYKFALDMLEKNKNNFTNEKYEKIKSIIEEKITQNSYIYFKKQEIESQYAIYNEPSEKNGYTILDIHKLNNILGIILSKVEYTHKVKLMKMLWYIDEESYKETGKSATGLVYLHQPMGALPIAHEEIIHLPALKNEMTYYANGDLKITLSLSENFKPKKISPKLENIIDKVVDKLGYLKTKDVVDYMHREKAYKETNEYEIIPFSEELKIKEF